MSHTSKRRRGLGGAYALAEKLGIDPSKPRNRREARFLARAFGIKRPGTGPSQEPAEEHHKSTEQVPPRADEEAPQ